MRWVLPPPSPYQARCVPVSTAICMSGDGGRGSRRSAAGSRAQVHNAACVFLLLRYLLCCAIGPMPLHALFAALSRPPPFQFQSTALWLCLALCAAPPRTRRPRTGRGLAPWAGAPQPRPAAAAPRVAPSARTTHHPLMSDRLGWKVLLVICKV